MSEPFTIKDLQVAWEQQKQVLAKMDQSVGPLTGTLSVLDKLLLISLTERYEKWLAEGIFAPEPAWQITPEDTPDRHKDYLPLNLWDQTPD